MFSSGARAASSLMRKMYLTPVVSCLIYWALSEWHVGEIASCHALMDEAISIAKELKDMNSLAMALSWAAALAGVILPKSTVWPRN